jgi:DNA-directed RNA polymerase specialized sigma24 family protein
VGLITIPFDFETNPQAQSVVPICIEETDRNGEAIEFGWFEAVVPVADSLRSLARRMLRDVWLVSELAEGSVHALWNEHGSNLGRRPSGQILADAKWRARNMRNGGRNARRGVEVELLESVLAGLRSPDDVARTAEARDIEERLKRLFEERGVPHVSEIMDLWLQGDTWPEIAEQIGKGPRTASKQLSRWFRRGLRRLNLL